MRVRVRRRVSGRCTFDLCLLGGDGTISQFYRVPVPRFFSYKWETAKSPTKKSAVATGGNITQVHQPCKTRQPIKLRDELRGRAAKKLPGTVKTKEEVITMSGAVMQAIEL